MPIKKKLVRVNINFMHVKKKLPPYSKCYKFIFKLFVYSETQTSVNRQLLMCMYIKIITFFCTRWCLCVKKFIQICFWTTYCVFLYFPWSRWNNKRHYTILLPRRDRKITLLTSIKNIRIRGNWIILFRNHYSENQMPRGRSVNINENIRSVIVWD